jgi:hypothetical protein
MVMNKEKQKSFHTSELNHSGLEGVAEQPTIPESCTAEPISLPVVYKSHKWLPSELWVGSCPDLDGHTPIECQINSYINSLHPEEQSDIYNNLAELFVHVVPNFEDTKEGFASVIHECSPT